jgi:hypothetical protein
MEDKGICTKCGKTFIGNEDIHNCDSNHQLLGATDYKLFKLMEKLLQQWVIDNPEQALFSTEELAQITTRQAAREYLNPIV